jgi:diguanylate cyclase (GGDEF)-like protein
MPTSYFESLLGKEKRFFVRFFRMSMIGIIVSLTLVIIGMIAVSRYVAFSQEKSRLLNDFEVASKAKIRSRVEEVKQFGLHRIDDARAESERVLAGTVLSVRGAVEKGYEKYRGKVPVDLFLARSIGDIRDVKGVNIADVEGDNRIFVIKEDGTLLVDANRPDLEGKNILEIPAYAAHLSRMLEHVKQLDTGVLHRGYVFGGKGHEDATVYIAYSKMLGVVFGSHFDRHDLMQLAKESTIKGVRNIFFAHDREMIVADMKSMRIIIHDNKDAVGKAITDYPELMESFGQVMKGLEAGEHFGDITCIRDFTTHLTDLKTVYVDTIPELGLVVSTGYFRSEHRKIAEARIDELESRMFEEMLMLIGITGALGFVALLVVRHFRTRISDSFDFFGEKIYEAHEAMAQLYVTDSLTGLPNRSALLETVDEREDVAVAIVNIDNFSQINDFYGHRFGDETLQYIANTLRQHFSDDQYGVYRLHADEFAVVMLGSDDLEGVLRPRVRELIMALRSGIQQIGDAAISIHLTAGLAAGYRKDADILIRADMAYKNARTNRFGCMSFEQLDDAHKMIKNNLEMVNTLKWAIENDKIVPYFQPLYNIKTARIDKYECLARMYDENGNVINPVAFLGAAQKSHLYHHITRIMLTKAIETFRDNAMEFTINIAMQDILAPGSAAQILQIIKASGIGKRLTLEIVESEALEVEAAVDTFFLEAKALGCKLAIDDFGTGYSNFNYLKTLKPDLVKLDGSLIASLKANVEQERLVSLILTYAQESGIKTVAEFVSDEGLLETVRYLGFDYAQGYHVGKPQPELQTMSIDHLKGDPSLSAML